MPELPTTPQLAGKSLRDEDDRLEAGPNEERKKKRRTDDIPKLRYVPSFWLCGSITFLIVRVRFAETLLRVVRRTKPLRVSRNPPNLRRRRSAQVVPIAEACSACGECRYSVRGE
jgi:hypothetical protein